MSSELKHIFAEVQAEEIWNYDDETFEQLWKPFKKIVRRWLERKKEHFDKEMPNLRDECETLKIAIDLLLKDLEI